MANKVLELVFRGKDDGVVQVMKQQGAEADVLKRKLQEVEAAKAAKNAAPGKSTLQSLKQGLGARSELGQLGKVAVGAGAVAGLTMVAHAIGEAATKAKELTAEFKAGKISAGEMGEKLAEGIPIVGSFISAGRQVKDLLASFDGLAHSWFGRLTGLNEMNDAAKIEKENAARKIGMDYTEGSLQRQKKLTLEMASASVARQERKIASGLDGYEKEQFEQKAAANNRLQQLEDKRQSAIETTNKAFSEKLAEADKLDDNEKATARANISKRHQTELQGLNKEFDQAARDERTASSVEEHNFWYEHHQANQRIIEKAQREINDIQAGSGIERLKALGKSLDAELALIEKNAQDKKDAIDAELKEQLKAAPASEADGLNEAAKGKKAAIDQAAAAQNQNLVYKELQDAQLKVLQAQADAGDRNAAVELQRVQSARDQTQEADKLLAIMKDQAATVEQRKTAEQDLKAIQAAQGSAIDKQLRDQNQTVLERQAAYGAAGDRVAAKKQLEQLKLTKSFEEQQQQTQAILKNPAATDAQKKAAAENLRQFAGTLGKQFDEDIFGKNSQAKTTAALEDKGLLLSGVAAAGKEKRNDPNTATAKNTAEANSLQRQLLAKFDRLLDRQQKPAVLISGVTE
jgi:hypothetical protein